MAKKRNTLKSDVARLVRFKKSLGQDANFNELYKKYKDKGRTYLDNRSFRFTDDKGKFVSVVNYNDDDVKNILSLAKINPTEQTSTFPVPVNKLKGHLMDNIGLKWTTPQGYNFEIKKEYINWIMANVSESMFNNSRCYIYNKAFYEAFFNPKHNPDSNPNWNWNLKDDRFDLIRQWAKDRGIYDKGNSHTQYVKLMEEAGELAKALLNKDVYEIKDAIGDMVVVLTNLAVLEGMQIENCIDSAYNEIANRKGKMINGTFVKSA